VIQLASDASVLAVVVARIGDTLLATPALRALRRASGRLTVLAHPKRLEVLQSLDFIDELGSITKDSAWFGRLFRRRRYDAAFCYGRDTALLDFCVRVAAKTVAFDHAELRGTGGQAVVRVPVPDVSSMHAVNERLLLAEAAAVHAGDLRLAYCVTPQEHIEAMAWIERNTAKTAGPLIGLQPLSFPTKAHRDWPLDRFVALAGRIARAYPQSHIFILGDASARPLASAFEAALPGRCTVAAGRLALRQSAALMQRLHLYVGVDTGPTHIAGALHVPMVALYHAAYAGRYLKPLDHPRCVVIEHPLTLTERRDGASMDAITLNQVWEAADRLLRSRAEQ
jgi:heptosyltransferase-3